MKILTVTQAYPSRELPSAMAFVHSRNLLYARSGHEVQVLSFDAKASYVQDGIQVLSEDELDIGALSGFDAVVFHAPNLRNHLRFYKENKSRLRNVTFVVHMVEWLARKRYWREPYHFFSFWRRKILPKLEDFYDHLKLWTWRRFLLRADRERIKIIFVSNWIREQAELSIGLNFDKLGMNARVIHNPIHPVFFDAQFDPNCPKVADFVTIRPLDDSKYGIDIVCKVAEKYPDLTFHVYGRGSFFKFIKPPANLSFFEGDFSQNDLPRILNKYRAALLPTRLDSQGVLMCEIAAMGMPLVVSNISICREMVGDFQNVAFIDNDEPELPLLPSPCVDAAKSASEKFWASRTSEQEIQVFTSWN